MTLEERARQLVEDSKAQARDERREWNWVNLIPYAAKCFEVPVGLIVPDLTDESCETIIVDGIKIRRHDCFCGEHFSFNLILICPKCQREIEDHSLIDTVWGLGSHLQYLPNYPYSEYPCQGCRDEAAKLRIPKLQLRKVPSFLDLLFGRV